MRKIVEKLVEVGRDISPIDRENERNIVLTSTGGGTGKKIHYNISCSGYT